MAGVVEHHHRVGGVGVVDSGDTHGVMNDQLALAAAGFRALPMPCRITQSAFRAMADQWLGESRALFTWCHRECGL